MGSDEQQGQRDTPRRGTSGTSAADRRAAEAQSGQREPRFTLERLRGVDGPAIVEAALEERGEPLGVSSAVLAGLTAAALEDVEDDDGLTRAQIAQRVGAIAQREDTTGRED